MRTTPLAWVIIAAALCGCAQRGVRNESYDYPSSVSYVWDDGTDTFIVPRKGTVIGSRVFLAKEEQLEGKLDEKGSYPFVPGLHVQMIFSDEQSNPIVVRRR